MSFIYLSLCALFLAISVIDVNGAPVYQDNCAQSNKYDAKKMHSNILKLSAFNYSNPEATKEACTIIFEEAKNPRPGSREIKNKNPKVESLVNIISAFSKNTKIRAAVCTKALNAPVPGKSSFAKQT